LKNLEINSDPKVESVFANYPDFVQDKMLELRKLVLETASETDEISMLEETLKWGEPSYLTKMGSTLRMDWKPKSPNQYAMYFKCTSKLVKTFKVVFGENFNYEGDRAIIFQLGDDIPKAQLKSCIKAALTYHKVKKLANIRYIKAHCFQNLHQMTFLFQN
jgi:hypothetical protein